MNLRAAAAATAFLLVSGCAATSNAPADTAPTPVADAAPADSALHVGATVRVRGSGLGRGWRVGTVAASTGRHPCLAVKLAALRTGEPFYVPVSRLSQVEADRRTNTGALTLGLPPASASDWMAVSISRAAGAWCRRNRQ